ncbi:MAG TPA: heme exporter protein CcmB [Patescibacteria group bacterium]|nr:heme exporter protein CcmB [Patescibacteria group bacterium]
MKALCAIVSRDLRLFGARGSELAATLFFFITVASMFPFALAQDPAALAAAAPAIIWVGGLLAALLSLDTIYLRDAEDGTLDLLLMSSLPAPVAVAKMLSHWLLSGLPLAVTAFPVAVMLGVATDDALLLCLSLLPGTIYMSLLGGAGAALTLGSRRSGLLLAVLVLPLFIPMLILGVMAAEASLADAPVKAYLLLQTALALAALPLAPAAAAAFFNMHQRSS